MFLVTPERGGPPVRAGGHALLKDDGAGGGDLVHKIGAICALDVFSYT